MAWQKTLRWRTSWRSKTARLWFQQNISDQMSKWKKCKTNISHRIAVQCDWRMRNVLTYIGYIVKLLQLAKCFILFFLSACMLLFHLPLLWWIKISDIHAYTQFRLGRMLCVQPATHMPVESHKIMLLASLYNLLNQKVILYQYSSCCCCSCWQETVCKKSLSLCRFKSDLDGTWQDCSSSKCPSILTESDFRFDATLSRWRPWRHFTQKSAATWWMNGSACRHLCSRAVFASSWYIVHSLFLFITCIFQT